MRDMRISSAPPTIPSRLQPPGPLGNTTMIDLIKKEQERDLSTLTGVHEFTDPKTMLQRLEEYEDKGKSPEHAPFSSLASPLPKRGGPLTPDKGVAKCVKNNWVPGGLSKSAHSTYISPFGAGPDRQGSSAQQSTFNRQGQSLSAMSNVPVCSRNGQEITGEIELLRFGILSESDGETMADRRRRLLELKESLNEAHRERPSSTSGRQVKSPQISTGISRHRSAGTIPSFMPRVSPLVQIPEESSASNSLGPALESETLPPSTLPIGSQRFKIKEGRHASIRSGRSRSSSSDLEFDSSMLSSAPKDLTPTSSLEKLADLRNLAESTQPTSEFEWLPKIEPCGGLGLLHDFSSHGDTETQPFCGSKSEGQASEIESIEYSANQGSIHERANTERQLVNHRGTGRRRRSRSFSSAETLLRIYSRRNSWGL